MSEVRTLDELAALFRALRRRYARTLEEKALPYRELAARTGWSHAVISDYFTGKVLPPTDRFDVLVQLLGATPEEQGELATARDRVEENRSAQSSAGRRRHASDTGKPASHVVTPHQLPAAPKPFAGRDKELAALTAAVHGVDSRVPMATIAGAGGIGKTWLAMHWAYQNLDRFPDGQLFVDLRGFSPAGEPMRSSVALRGFLGALGVEPHQLPPDPHAQSALYRSLVSGKQMLILLDNAVDADQVVPLLPGSASCTVLVTSRRLLTSLVTRYNAHPVHVGVLAHDEARHLLHIRLGKQRTTREPDAITELLTCCAGYPLALSIVAGRASTAPDVPLTELVTDLRDTTSRIDVLDDDDPAASLPAALSWSLHGLTVEQRGAFELLGIAPGPDISLAAAASLLDLPAGQAKRIMRTLEEASLLDRDASGRYAMHDLIRTYAAGERHNDAGTAALRRVLDFYIHTAYVADRVLYPHREPVPLPQPSHDIHPQPLSDLPTAMAWFNIEYPNLLAAQHAAVLRKWPDTVWYLAWSLATYMHSRGHRNDRLAVWQAALDATQDSPDPTQQIVIHRQLGQACTDLSRHDQAADHLHHALTLAEHHDNPTQQAHTHHILIWTCSRRGDNQQALEHATQALRLYRTTNQPAWEADALNAAGWCAAQVGDFDSARAYCDTALTLYQNHDDLTGVAGTLDNLGYIDHHTGNHHRAVDHYQQALTLVRQLGHAAQTADVLHSLGNPYIALGQHEQAHAAWHEALTLYREQGRDTDADRVLQQLETEVPGR